MRLTKLDSIARTKTIKHSNYNNKMNKMDKVKNHPTKIKQDKIKIKWKMTMTFPE